MAVERHLDVFKTLFIHLVIGSKGPHSDMIIWLYRPANITDGLPNIQYKQVNERT